MAITAVGFDGSYTEAQFARFTRHHDEVSYRHGVSSGFTPSVGTGTRAIAIAAGTAVLPGLLVDSTATETVTLAANTGSGNRVDMVTLLANWTTNTVAPAVVQGSGSTAPTLPQTEGNLWHMPIARVTVRPNVSVIAAGDIVSCYPRKRDILYYQGSDFALGSVGPNSTGVVVSSVTLVDPGWPYVVKVEAQMRVIGDDGYGAMSVLLDGSRIAYGVSSRCLEGGRNPVHANGRSSTTSGGPRTVQVRLEPVQVQGATNIDVLGSSMNALYVWQIPS
jgi:hypothetical protein